MSEGQKLSMGRKVLVRLTADTEGKAGIVRPAEVVRVWSDDCANLLVFLDGENDMQHAEIAALGQGPLLWLTSVTKGEQTRQWSWPPRV